MDKIFHEQIMVVKARTVQQFSPYPLFLIKLKRRDTNQLHYQNGTQPKYGVKKFEEQGVVEEATRGFL